MSRPPTGAAASPWEVRFFERAKSPPTAEKHRVLASAFHEWLAEGPPGVGRIVFDGFAGAGRFGEAGGCEDAELGSPLLLLRWVQGRAGGPWRLVFSEKDPVNCSRLCVAVGRYLGQAAGTSYRLPNGSVEVHHTTFEQCAGELLGGPAASCFSFVDPYRYDGVRFSTVSALAGWGHVVFHLASQAIRGKLGSASGESAKQARRMDAFLGGPGSWMALRREASGLVGGREALARVLLDRLEREHPGLRARITELRRGEAHMICMAPAEG